MTNRVGLAALVMCAVGCGGAPISIEYVELAPDAGAIDGDAGTEAEKLGDPPSEDAGAADSAPAEDSAPAADAGAEQDTAATVPFACFSGRGVASQASPTSVACQPTGPNSAVCDGCVGQYMYSCDDGLPPASDCVQPQGGTRTYCCVSNVCTKMLGAPDCTTGALRVEYGCNVGVAAPTGCALAPTFGTGPNTNAVLAYCCRE